MWQQLSADAAATQRQLRGKAGATTSGDAPGINALRVDALVAAILKSAPSAPDASASDASASDASPPDASTSYGPAPDALASDRASSPAGTCGAAAGTANPGRRRPTAPPSRVRVNVTIDLATLLALADHPAELAGYGPIPAALARGLAPDGEWVRWITDPQTGQLLDLGRRSYRPSAALAAFVRAAHPVCGWIGCRQPAHRCDIDHKVPFAVGGVTDREGLGPLCRQHHNAKTHGGWRYERDRDHTGHLTSPLGHRYDIPPPQHPPRL